MRPSRGFVAALFGLATTLFSWYGPWEWPGWPAFAALNLVFGNRTSWLELGYGAKGVVILLLIALNVAVWATLFLCAAAVVRRLVSMSRKVEASN